MQTHGIKCVKCDGISPNDTDIAYKLNEIFYSRILNLKLEGTTKLIEKLSSDISTKSKQTLVEEFF